MLDRVRSDFKQIVKEGESYRDIFEELDEDRSGGVSIEELSGDQHNTPTQILQT